MSRLWSPVVDRQQAWQSIVDQRCLTSSVRQSQERVLDDLWQRGMNPVLAEEDRAYAMLYSGLDDEQQRIYDDLVAAGVLPDRVAGRVAD